MEEKKSSKAKNLILSLIELFCPFNVKCFQIGVGITTALLLGIVILLGWISTKKIKEIVIEDFNKQQLLLARHTSSQIENIFNTLKRELLILSLSPSIQYPYSDSIVNASISVRMLTTFSSIGEYGAQEIHFVDNERKKTHILDHAGYRILSMQPIDEFYLDWSKNPKNKGHIMVSDVKPMVITEGKLKQIVTLSAPVWQDSVDEAHPIATRNFAGALIFTIDATALVENVTRSIKSGKTGYAWVIDNNAIFLYHPVEDFIGKNAFEVRHKRKTVISFDKINEIQKEKMLAGKEGTGSYISGWHGEVEGEIKKLIAYNPIRLNGGNVSRVWSVAVVAPISEVEGAIHSVYIRQFLFQGIVSLGILLGGVTIFFLIFNWSNQLGEEVEKRTSDLKKSEERYKCLIENAEDIIFTADYNGRYLSINNYGAQVFHKKPEAIIGQIMSDILPDETTQKQMDLIKDIFNTGLSQQMTYSVMIDNCEHWFSTNLSPLIDEECGIFAVLGITRDITHRKKIEEQEFYYYTEKLASLGTLAAGVAHEINNPLAIILGHTDLLMEKVEKDSAIYKSLKTIERQGLNAKRIVENLLSFSSFSEKKEEWIDINVTLETVLTVIGDTLLINKIELKKQLAEILPKVKGNAEEMQQVFFNIINNAVHAMKGGGTLTVITETIENRGKVLIKVIDTGHGIRRENLNKIFDPLFTTKKAGEGTGLGLSVSYGIINKYRGSITCQSIARDEAEQGQESGTTFTIVLPAISMQDISENPKKQPETDIETALSDGLTRLSAFRTSRSSGVCSRNSGNEESAEQ
ncbi:MAG: ATP-binding protein [Nitrospirota bacterium]